MTHKYSSPCRVAVLGASGFAGGELLRILARHPGMQVVAAGAASRAGRPVGELYPWLPVPGGTFVSAEDALGDEPDVVFASLPHTQSMALLGAWEGPAAVDLGGDFRLRDPGAYREWYGQEHTHPGALGSWVYGLTEWRRADVAAARRVANPGCYPTAALLALAPLLAAGAVRAEGIHIDAQSGVSGAGRATGEGFDFVSVNENLRPYAPTGHKHIAEIEQELSAVSGGNVAVSFVPHLVPVTRGLLATCTAPLAGAATTEELVEVVRARYRGEPFVRVLGASILPETGRVTGTNMAEVAVRADPRTGRAIAMAAIDNLGKGAAGQAVQNANLMLGFAETAGLDAAC
ncbi:MAG TPA: N-acetyl-gamma-glutamyl-phosphate reductase [Actinomycetota bacterium]|nr:N-acetyl-gamma-glutamyl-phosphate reductase [Actinomycetota bacterium]